MKSIHVDVHIDELFLLIEKDYSIEWKHHDLFIQSAIIHIECHQS